MLCSPKGIQKAGEQSDTENDCRDPGYFEDGSPVKCHVPSLAAVGRRPLIHVKKSAPVTQNWPVMGRLTRCHVTPDFLLNRLNLLALPLDSPQPISLILIGIIAGRRRYQPRALFGACSRTSHSHSLPLFPVLRFPHERHAGSVGQTPCGCSRVCPDTRPSHGPHETRSIH